MDPFLNRLKREKVLLADGAVGTMLVESGFDPGDCFESFNLTRPVIVAEIARLYLEAGADIIQTHSINASPFKLSEVGLSNRSEEINRAAVRIARAVVGEAAYVSGTCGPTGAPLEPVGNVKPEDLYEVFEGQIMALVMEGVDVVSIEAMVDLREAVIAVSASKTLSPNTPVMAGMIFGETPAGYRTAMGVGVREAAESLRKAGADIIGACCGGRMKTMIEVAEEFKRITSLPLVMKPDVELPRDRRRRGFYADKPEFFAEKAVALMEAGVSIIGGCRGATPAHIRAMRDSLWSPTG